MSQVDLKLLKHPVDQDENALYEDIRSDLEDSLKEYAETDLLVELLQNALDAMDERRYREICAAAGVEPGAAETILAWNKTVDDLVDSDFASFPRHNGVSAQAVWQSQQSLPGPRRTRWAQVLVENLGLEQAALDSIAGYDSMWAQLHIKLDLSSPHQLTITDTGVGMSEPLAAFRHKGSTKRTQGAQRRRGTRGSHGWGLSAILGYCDRVEIVTKPQGQAARGLRLERFASFRSDSSIMPEITEFAADELDGVGLPNIAGESGTTVRVALPPPVVGGLLERLITTGSVDQWANALRLHTPVGQVNDYVLHPSFHCLRRDDLEVSLDLRRGDEEKSVTVSYDYLRMSDLRPDLAQDLQQFVDAGQPSGKSVYCVGRERAGQQTYLIAGEIQASKPTLAAVEETSDAQLVAYDTEAGDAAPKIPRGIYLALSGGMRSESVALPPLSTNAAFRGIILAETAKATLGRRHTMDQRTSIPAAAKSFASTYDAVRKKTIPSGQAVLTGPALNQWLRKLWRKVIEGVAQEPPQADLRVWGGAISGEARVMMAYSELLGRGLLGDVRVLHASLKEVYDFEFVYRWASNDPEGPPASASGTLVSQGFAAADGGQAYRRLAIGEFKDRGDALIGEFDTSGADWRKNPNSVDLLVCWDFDESVLGEAWTSSPVALNMQQREFQGQTHTWSPTPGSPRTRPLPVICLSELINQLVASGQLAANATWQQTVGDNYYDD